MPMRADIQADSMRFRFTTPSGITMVKCQIKKSLKFRHFNDFLFCPFISKNSNLRSRSFESPKAEMPADKSCRSTPSKYKRGLCLQRDAAPVCGIYIGLSL